MKARGSFLLLAVFFLLAPISASAQMGGAGGMHGGGNSTGQGNTGMMSGLTGLMEGMGVMSGHDVTIGDDGIAYILDPDLSVPGAGRTVITAVSPRSANASEWKATLSGLVHQIAAGADRVVVSAATEGFMWLGIVGLGNVGGMHGTIPATLAPLKGKLYFLNATDGAVVRTVDHDGLATSLIVRKAGNTEYVYLVTRERTAGLWNGLGVPKAKLSIYRMDGSAVKTVDLAADAILEQP